MNFNLEKIKNKVFLGKFLEKKEIFKDTFCFTFKTEESFSFLSGQYIWIDLHKPLFEDMKGKRRAFSISNSPNDQNIIEIILRKSESAFNKSLFSLKTGDELDIIGPNGFSFVLKDEYKDKHLVLVAGGVGVSPFLSILRDVHKNNKNQKIDLIYAEKTKDAFLYKDELESFNSQFLKISFIEDKIVFEHLSNIQNIKDCVFFVSGRQEFIDYIYDLLKQNGIFEHQFVFEQFYPTSNIDKEISNIFLNGKPNMLDIESSSVKDRMRLIYKLVESSSSHIIVTDINGRVLFANEAAQRITGFSIEEMLGNTPRLWGGLMSDNFYKKLWDSKLKGLPINDEVLNRRKNDEIYIASAHISPIKDENNQVVGFVASEEDVTHLRISENKARKNEERFLQLVQNIPEIYWIIDVENEPKMMYASPNFEDIFNLPIGELYKNCRAWVQKVEEKDKKFVAELFDNFLKGKNDFDIEFAILGKNDQKIILYNKGELIKDEKGKLIRVVGVTRDVTKEKEIDKAKTEFVSLASHQLKTPVGAMRWNLEMLLAGDFGELSEKQKEIIEEVQNLNRRTSELVNDFLDVSRIEMGTLIVDLEIVDISKIIEDVLLEFKEKIETKKISFIDKIDRNIKNINADKRLLRIIFQNLISNAIKYSNDGGSVEVSVSVKEDKLEICVKDEGMGIKEEEKDKIFTKMFRGSNANEKSTEGNGLGLYLLKEIVKKTGGEVYFESELGRGTTFYILFSKEGMKK